MSPSSIRSFTSAHGFRKQQHEADADHAPPFTFDMLAKMFLGAHKIEPSEAILAPSGDNQYGDFLLDRDLAAQWREFHHQHADVRIVAKQKHRTLTQIRRRPDNRQLTLSEGD
jgi:hypothetical protein